MLYLYFQEFICLSIMSFNQVAPYYGLLSRIVFGKAMINAKRCFLDIVNETDRILIIGGGNGDILPILPSGSEITFLDPSERMIQLAQRSNTDNTTFIQSSFERLNSDKRFSIIIAQNYFDLYTTEGLIPILSAINDYLEADGKLIVTEFTEDKQWQRLMLSVMYVFFGWMSSIQNQRLPNWQEQLRSKFQVQQERSYYAGFILSVLGTKGTW